MNEEFLDFEQPIAELEAKIQTLATIKSPTGIDLNDEIKRLKQKSDELTKKIFSALEPVQIAKLARHPMRPHTSDYISLICTDFEELAGDRNFGDDKAIICGIARIDEQPVAVIGHEKGRATKEKIICNFGMPKPEGYRKALRIMQLAERFKFPIITFIDTAGAYPGINAEERGQAEAIARNLRELSVLKVPIICNVIGEGGSGGALAIGVGDRVNMLEFSTYSVISPEGCASILWKNAEKADIAAKILGITAKRLQKLKLIDSIIDEPLGGAHRNYEGIALSLKQRINKDLKELQKLDKSTLLKQRYNKLISYGYV